MSDEQGAGSNYEECLEITADEVIAALKSLPFRTTGEKYKEGFRAEIFYKEKWRELGRCDWSDDVRTFVGFTSQHSYYDEPIAHFCSSILNVGDKPGARITEDGFFVIDALSDG